MRKLIGKIFFLLALLLNTTLTFAESELETSYISKSYSEPHATGLVWTPDAEEFFNTAPQKSFIQAVVPIPKKYSMRGKLGAIEDQGNCGSCWDFSLTTALRGSWISKGRDPGRLSYNYLLNCAKEQYDCHGGNFSAAAHLVAPKAVPSYGSDGEYLMTTRCLKGKPAAATASYVVLGARGNIQDERTPSFKDIAYVVGILRQPVVVDLISESSFQNYGSGVYTCGDYNPRHINHMVVIEGYDCEKSVDANGNCVFDEKGNLPPGVGRWIVRNSWGSNWGDNGYITMKATNSKGLRCNAIGTHALYYKLFQ